MKTLIIDFSETLPPARGNAECVCVCVCVCVTDAVGCGEGEWGL